MFMGPSILEEVGVVTDQGHGDGLGLEVEVETILALVAAHAGILVAAEGRRVVEDVVGVDPDGAGAQRARHAVDSVDVLAEDARGEAVVGVVAAADDVLLVGELGDGHDRSEDLLAEELGVVGDVREDGGLDVVARLVHAVAAGDEVEALVLAALDVAHDAIELQLVHLRALVHLAEGIADAALLRLGRGLGHELVVDVLVHEDAGARAAALAVVEEEPEVHLLHGLVDVHVAEDDGRGLAAELQGQGLDARDLLDAHGRGHTAREGQLVHAAMLGQRLAGRGAHAGNDVHHALREAGVDEDLTELQRGDGCLLGGLQHHAAASSERRGQLKTNKNEEI